MSTGLLFIDGPAGRIEALRADPAADSPAAIVILCHPHPLHGGTMHGKLMHRVARATVAAGAIALRFQFRGVGRSEGTHDHGRGELGDVAAVITHAAAIAPGLPISVIGYSFGAWVGLRAGAGDPRVATLVGVGLALSLHDFSTVATSAKRKTVIQGDSDTFGPIAMVAAEVETWMPPRQLITIVGADHFFTASLDEVATEVASAAITGT